MRQSLYELTTEIANIEEMLEEWASGHEGDITDFPLYDELEKSEGAKDEKSLSVGIWYKNMISEEKAIAEEIKSLSARKTTLKNKSERIKSYLQENMENGTKLENARCKIGWKKSSSVSLFVDPDKLPEDFKKVTITADKAALKDFCKTGINNYAEIVHKNNITIK